MTCLLSTGERKTDVSCFLHVFHSLRFDWLLFHSLLLLWLKAPELAPPAPPYNGNAAVTDNSDFLEI